MPVCGKTGYVLSGEYAGCGKSMEINMRKLGLTLAVAASLCMTACGASIPELTEEQNALVVEYAAGLLLKYDANYENRLVEESEPEEEPPAVTEEPPAEEPQPAEEQETEAPEVVDISEEPEAVVYHSIEEFYGIDGVTVTFMGYELKDMYPDQGEEEMFFAMNASEGCKLVVMHFDVTNVSGQDKALDMLSLNTKFKISFNGESPRYALTTMLTNDLASYNGSIAAGAKEELVLIAELQEDKAQSIQTISLIMRNAADEATLPLN